MLQVSSDPLNAMLGPLDMAPDGKNAMVDVRVHLLLGDCFLWLL
jgi:hypothetical protein